MRRKTQMLWHGRPHVCGSWLIEDKKASMWHGRGKCCGLWPPAFTPLLRDGSLCSSIKKLNTICWGGSLCTLKRFLYMLQLIVLIIVWFSIFYGLKSKTMLTCKWEFITALVRGESRTSFSQSLNNIVYTVR